jgi:hypothetical protein
MQASWQTTLFNYTTSAETRLPNITKAQKTYPASGATAMLPLTGEACDSPTRRQGLIKPFVYVAANGWKPTLLFCGGMDPERDE